jgi:cyclic-di-GMP-binding protein
MPSFDIVSKVDLQKLDNAINTAKKEISTRYDFSDSRSEVDLDKKTLTLHIVTENDMRMKAIEGVIISRVVKQGIEASCLDFGKEHYASGNMIKKDVKIKEGIDREAARKIIKIIKDSGLKVQASIMEDQLRVTGKKIDDLQKVIATVRAANLEIALQYENFRS